MTWTVSEVMTKDPVTVGSAMSFKSCLNLMRIHGVGEIPVITADGRLIGIVSESDLLAKEVQRPVRDRPAHTSAKAKAMTVAELMTAHVVTTTATAPLATAASLMFERRLNVLPVVDSRKRLVGIVSRSQVLKVFLRSDESIRREVVRDLLNMPLIGLGNVDVEVNDGVVTLYGVDDAEGHSELVSRHVAGMPGVVGVKRHPKLTREVEAAHLAPAESNG
jgi:CBS domain-containing protein